MEGADPLLLPPWEGAGLTDIGRVRTTNQDAFAVENQLGLWVIADGMGGHAGGSIASHLAVTSVVDFVRTSNDFWTSSEDRRGRAIKLLTGAVSAGHAAIRNQVATAPNLAGMGTTLVAALFCPSPQMSIVIAHVGDSRAYLIRDCAIQPLTTDHSFVQRLLTEGRITSEESKTHPQQNILLRALGAEDQADPDIEAHTLNPRDILLLCTDGLTKTVSEAEILALILATQDSSLTACQRLIDRSNAQGGKDNTTVVLVSLRSASTLG